MTATQNVLEIGTIEFNGEMYQNTILVKETYSTNGGVAIDVYSDSEGQGYELVDYLTVNVAEDPRTGNKVWTGVDSGPNGLLEALEDKNLVKRTGKSRNAGYKKLYEIELLEKLKAL